MSDPTPEARLRRSRGFMLVWLVPLAALAIVIWLGVRTLIERGPLVTISFDTAEGLEAGRTRVRHKAVDIGTVESVTLSQDLKHVIVTARIDRSAADAVTSGTAFWIVRPRLSPGGISGLSTIVSGAYLEMEPGHPGTGQSEFKGLEEPPVLAPDEPGRTYLLHAGSLGGLDSGSPIYHRGIVVGEVLGGQLARDGGHVDISAFVRAPYADLVTPRTRFWNTSGISISAGPNGVKASLESLQALVTGGVEFDAAADGPAEPPSPQNAEFRLFDDAASAQSEPWGESATFLVDLPGPVHGLADGAPVELEGQYFGRVTELHLHYDRAGGTLSNPVTIEVEPERVKGFTPEPGHDGFVRSTNALIEGLVAKGLRAHLGTANLLTGQRMIALDIDAGARPATVRQGGPYPALPVGEGGDLDALTRSASRALDGLSQIPFKDIGDHVSALTQHLDTLVGGPEMKQAVAGLNGSLAGLNKLMGSANQELPALIRSLNGTADAATRALEVLGGEGGRGTDLRGLLHELQEAARSMRALADMLQEHPEALLKGRSDAK